MAWFVASQYADADRGTYHAPDVEPLAEDLERVATLTRAARDRINRHWIDLGEPDDCAELPFFGGTGLPRLDEGWPWPMIDRPLRAVVTREGAGSADIIHTGFGQYGLSPRVIDLIEGIEPGVHRYWPFELLEPSGIVRSSDYRMLVVGTRAECIDTARSDVSWNRNGIVSKFGTITVGGRQPHLVVDATSVQGRAIWHEWRFSSGRSFMVGDRLWDGLRREGIRGWQPHWSYPDHIEES